MSDTRRDPSSELLIFQYHCYLKYVYTVEWRKGGRVEKLLENISRKIKTYIDVCPGRHYTQQCDLASLCLIHLDTSQADIWHSYSGFVPHLTLSDSTLNSAHYLQREREDWLLLRIIEICELHPSSNAGILCQVMKLNLNFSKDKFRNQMEIFPELSPRREKSQPIAHVRYRPGSYFLPAWGRET